MADVAADAVRAELERVLASRAFAGATRSSQLLRHLVEETLAGRADRLKEYTIGTEGLGRGDGFDPRSDPIVRAEASRVRSRLDLYYAGEGRASEVALALPKGAYVPSFERRTIAPQTDSPPRGGWLARAA